VAFRLELTTPACPVKDEMEREAKTRVAAIPGVTRVDVAMSAKTPASPASFGAEVLPGVRHAVAVASGKGGVGKSTVAVNLAACLAASGATVGLMDADIYGPSIPIMLVCGIEPPEVRDGKILPLERFGLRMMSVGFLAGEDTPVIWRGPLVGKLVQQFLADVDWGELADRIIDLPPGTGDAQLTLTQAAPLAGAVIVTTPQPVALEDVKRGVRMFEKVNVPVLGIVENMAYFVCPTCSTRHSSSVTGVARRRRASSRFPFWGRSPWNRSSGRAETSEFRSWWGTGIRRWRRLSLGLRGRWPGSSASSLSPPPRGRKASLGPVTTPLDKNSPFV
jgi:ATP-binding protein involved in chromosome partitioning